MKQDVKDARILVVDDLIANVDMVVTYLEMEGYKNIIATTDARDVVDLYNNTKPDILLMDISMPHYNGLELMEMIRRNHPENDYLPILILTADITSATKRKALQAGASDFLTKPFDLIELKARVNTHLQIRFKNNEINDYARELKEQIAIKDKFFSIIAHDVRNPFTGIINYTKILQTQDRTIDPEELKRIFKIINTTATQGYDLLENLLKWSKSQTGSLQITPVCLSLLNSIESCVHLVENQSRGKNITLRVDVDSALTVNTDKDMFETIIRNLISNAVKFTNPDGMVTVFSQFDDHEIRILVQDNGIGISPDEKEKLFRIDSKLQSRKGTADETGSGLGLILCSEFAMQLGGAISFESEEGNGTTFILHLPAGKPT